MSRISRPFALPLVLSLAGLGLATTPAVADDAPTPDEARLERLVDRIERLENELLELKAQQGKPIAGGQQKILTIVETPFLGSTSYGSPSGRRYLASRLVFVNLTNEQITVEPPKAKLVVDGKPVEFKEVPSNMQYYSFQIGNQSHQLRNMKPTPQLVLRPGATGSTWMIHVDLPQSNSVPPMEYEIPVGEKTVRINVNQSARDALAMEVERIGPSRSLGLVTLGGSINTINAGALVEAMDHLTSQKVARVVIRWSESAAPLDGNIWGWLQQAAAYAGRQEMQNQQFPIFPVTIRELHLANAPGQNARSRNSYGNFSTQGRIHEDDATAIAAALRSAYEILPRPELLDAIRNGDALTRAAAISGGGGRLASEHLPLLLAAASDDDPRIQQAALRALRHFGEQEAIDRLVELVKKNTQPLSTIAIESLARSRFPNAHEALLAVLAEEPAKSKIEIVKVLAQYPRPIWADTIFEFVHSDNQTVASAALNALVQIGHPKLFDVLEKHLAGSNSAMQDQAFRVLVGRTDPDSEELAMEYTLKKLESSPPSSYMFTLLNRTKDPRSIPALLKHFESSSNNRSQVINTLAQIGDEVVADAFAKRYGTLQGYEKVNVLRALQQMRSPAFRDLAGKALLTTDSSLISTACEGLRLDAGPEAVTLLADALEKTSNTSAMSYISNTLGQLATPEAKQALRTARTSGDQNKRQYAVRALRNLYQRSPGYNYLYQARNHVKSRDYKKAIEQFDIALVLDPQYPEALAERGNAHLNQNDLAKARADYKQALELDSWNSHAITGMGLVLAREDHPEEAIKFVEDQAEKHPNDNVFEYNVACVLARAAESLKRADEPNEDRIAELKAKAVSRLARAKELGFSELDWMKKDPDLESLHGLPAFEKIHTPKVPEPEEGGDEGDVATEAEEAAVPLREGLNPFALQ